jgi:hypothetical protein
MVNDDFFRISIPVEICGSRSVWIKSGILAARRCAAVELTSLLHSPSGSNMRGRRGREGEAHGGEERRAPQRNSLICYVLLSSSHEASFYRREGAPLPPTKATLGPAARGGREQP